MKMIISIVLAVMGHAAMGQGSTAAYPCIPKEYGGTGDLTSIAETPYAVSIATRCPNAPIVSRPIYRRTWLKSFMPSVSCMSAIAPIAAANAASAVASRSLLPMINAAAAACDTIPAVGTIERQWFDEAASLSLMMLRSKYAAENPPGGPVLKATGGTIYKFESNKLTPIFTRKATVGATCNCSLARTSSGTLTLCALDGGVATEVTACK